ncbi:MAG: DUF4252 domain-containing protein [Staphylococcus sp.]|nr:DUF4252 domain-containing protein [Staphylococcus sp.]
MKRLFTLILLVVSIMIPAMAQNVILKKCEKIKELTTVYISKQMLEMAANAGVANAGAFDMLTNKLDEVIIVNSENVKGISILTKMRSDFTPKKGYEVLMQINDGKDNIVIYRSKKTDTKNEYIVSVLEEKEAVLIVVTGNLTMEDLTKISSSMARKKTKK